MVQEQWLQLKMMFLLGYNIKIVIEFGEINLWWGRNKNFVGEVFLGGEQWANFWLVGETSPIPPVGKALLWMETS